MGSYHRRPLRDAHSSHRILRVHRAPRQSFPSVPTDILRDTVMVCLQQLVLLGTDAAADALAAVGVNCSASSSSELSACWLGSFHRCSTVYSPPSLTETTCLLLTYVLNLGVNAVDHTVPSNNTGLTSNAYVCSCSTPVRHFPVLQIPVLQIQLSHQSFRCR